MERIKNEKHGLPDRVKLAKEAQDVLRCVLQIVTHYEIEAGFDASIEASYRSMQQSGLID